MAETDKVNLEAAKEVLAELFDEHVCGFSCMGNSLEHQTYDFLKALIEEVESLREDVERRDQSNLLLLGRGEDQKIEIEDMQASADLRWKADQRAIKRWQEATGKIEVWPDHADLCVWLLEQLDGVRVDLDEERAQTGAHQQRANEARDQLVRFSAWLDLQINNEEYYSGGPMPVERLDVLRKVKEKLDG